MIIIDTNVISELMKPVEIREMRVFRWIGSLSEDQLASTVINYAEGMYGVEKLPEGKRKRAVHLIFNAIFDGYFGDRVYLFDKNAAAEYASLVVQRERTGQPILEHDAQIAAIARVNHASIATRDSDFRGCGVDVINPWDYTGP